MSTRPGHFAIALGLAFALAGCSAESGSDAQQEEVALSADTQINVRRTYDEAVRAIDYCAASFQAVSDGATRRGASPQSLYPLASAAHDRCRDSSLAFNGMRPPEGATREARRAFDGAFRTCALAYAGHQRTAEALMRAIDNGLQPSLVAQYQQLAQEAVTGKAICASQIAQATRGAGVEVSG